MNTRLFIGVGAFGFLAVGCTLIVGNKFSETDDYKQNVNPADTARDEQCALPTSNKVAPECGKCITDSCKSEVDFACGRTEKNSGYDHFRTAQSCANSPDQFSGWGCNAYANSKVSVIPNPTKESEHKQNLEACIRDSCVLSGETPPCKTCVPSITVGNDTFTLGKGACGGCIANACKVQLVRCCTSSTGATIVDDIAYCAAPQLGTNRNRCLSAFDAPDGGTKSDAGTCDPDLRACMAQCKPQCTDTSKD